MNLTIRQLGQIEYKPALEAMQAFNEHRTDQTNDEIWLLEHPPVFTQGLAGKEEHILDAGDIPVVQIDRGGQITYHGPGQLICYVLLNLRRLDLTIKGLVNLLEQTVIDLLKKYGVESERREKAPGIYVDQSKIAALGLRLRKGCTFHGFALNVDMDLEPFLRINPCGYSGMKVTQLSDLSQNHSLSNVRSDLIKILCVHLNYNSELANWESALPN